jgi:hypothetical protein
MAMVVQPGRMITAVAFFTELLGGWREAEEAAVQGDWGQARFVECTFWMSCFRIQLSEPKGEELIPMSDNHHIALRVRDPQTAAHHVMNYFNRWLPGEGETIATKLPGGKYWVEIPSIFATAIEFVPM